MHDNRSGPEAGFTLIELLIVVVVLGILSGVVIFAVGSSKADATSSACKTNFKSVELSAEAVYSKTGAYPTVGGFTANTQSALDAQYANLLDAANNGATLKEYPFSDDYRLVYAPSGSTFTITVQHGNGNALSLSGDQSVTRTSGCDAL